MILHVFLDYLGVLVSPKINNIGPGAQGHVPKSRNHTNYGSEGSHISESKSDKLKLKRNNTTDLLAYLCYKFTIQMAQKSPKMSKLQFSGFSWIFSWNPIGPIFGAHAITSTNPKRQLCTECRQSPHRPWHIHRTGSWS